MKRINNNKGITLVALVITITIMGIILGIALSNMDTGADIRNYNNMCADIELLEAKVREYYNNNRSIPITGEAIPGVAGILDTQKSSRDNENYYQIDLSRIYNVSLNYGGGSQSNHDIYDINEQSHEIYYLKGVALEGTLCYRKK